MEAHAHTAQWTEPPSTGVASRLTRVYLAEENGRFSFTREGPAGAVLQEQAGVLRLDEDTSVGKRLAVGEAGQLLIY
jgi:hypothetical protein